MTKQEKLRISQMDFSILLDAAKTKADELVENAVWFEDRFQRGEKLKKKINEIERRVRG